MKHIAISAAKQLDNVVSLIEDGAKSWEQAGRIVTCLRLQTPDAYEQIIKMRPWITHALLHTLERIGSHEVYPYVLLEPKTASRWLVGYPYEEQKRACTEGVDVLKYFKNGKPVVERKRLNELSISDARKVFGACRLNTPNEQLQFMAPSECTRMLAVNTPEKELPVDTSGEIVKPLAFFRIRLRKETFDWERVSSVPDDTPTLTATPDKKGQFIAYVKIASPIQQEHRTPAELEYAKFKEGMK